MLHADASFFYQFSNTDYEKTIHIFLDELIKYKKNLRILVPTFTYSFCKKKIFNIKKTSSEVGDFSNSCLKFKKFTRSINPIFSFNTYNFTKDLKLINHNTCFGINSIFDYFSRKKGRIIVLGASFERSATFIHHIEEIKRVSYRYYKNFSGIIIDKKNSKKPFQIRYFVRKKKLNKKIKEKKLSSFYHSFEYGRHNVFHVKSNILQNKCLNELSDNEFFLVH
tara:strand:+ start:1274 stop:1942 length:669 start_codon:yes stop_codon:yes gene_type:complete